MSVKVGDKIRFNRDGLDVTEGEVYTVDYFDDKGIRFIDDNGDEHYWEYPSEDYEVISTKTTEDLIASLAQTVTQLERELNELKYKYEIDREMFIDDIAMIDERTQPKAESNSEINIIRKTVTYEYER